MFSNYWPAGDGRAHSDGHRRPAHLTLTECDECRAAHIRAIRRDTDAYLAERSAADDSPE